MSKSLLRFLFIFLSVLVSASMVRAELIAVDNFGDRQEGDLLEGDGFGWAGDWFGAVGQGTYGVSDFLFSSVARVFNHETDSYGEIGNTARVGRGFDDSLNIGADGTTLYLGLSVRALSISGGDPLHYYGLEFHRGGSDDSDRILQLSTDGPGTNQLFLRPHNQGGSAVPAAALSPVVQYWVVKVEFGVGGQDRASFFLNPTLNEVEGAADAVVDGNDLSFDRIHLASFLGSGSVAFDNLRLGTEFSDVVGLPVDDPNLTLLVNDSLFGDLRGITPQGPIARNITLKNTGQNEELIISSLSITGENASAFRENSMGEEIRLAPDEERIIEVILTPPPEGGLITADLEVVSNDESEGSQVFSLEAIVASNPGIEVMVGEPLFGLVSESGTVERTLRIRSTGTEALEIDEVFVRDDEGMIFDVVSPAPTSIPGGEEIEILVTFDSLGVEGAFEAELLIGSNDSLNFDTIVPLRAVFSTQLEEELIAFYPFDGSNASEALRDLSGNEFPRDAAASGTPPFYDENGGFEGGAFSFDRSGWLVAPLDISSSEFPFLTAGAWVKTDLLDFTSAKIFGNDDGEWDRALGLDSRLGSDGFSAHTGSGPLPGIVKPLNADDWAFVAVTWDQLNAEVKVYVDLTADETSDPLVVATNVMGTGSIAPGFSELGIGAHRPDSSNEGWFGEIDNLFFFQGVLSEERLNEIRRGQMSAILAQPLERLEVTEMVLNPEGENRIRLTWKSRPGQRYQLRFTSDLAQERAAWDVEGGIGIPSQGNLTTFTTAQSFDPSAPEMRQLFFAVERIP